MIEQISSSRQRAVRCLERVAKAEASSVDSHLSRSR
jgi:hypothetical protein